MRDYPVSSLVTESMTNGSSVSGFVTELIEINELYYPQSQQPAGEPCAHIEKQNPSQPQSPVLSQNHLSGLRQRPEK